MAVLVYIVGVLFAINTASALSCYNCDSSQGIGQCNWGILSLSFPSVDCSEGDNALTGLIPKSCVKVVGKAEDGKEYVARGCIPSIGQGLCNTVIKTAGFFSQVNNVEKIDFACSTCDSDNCNSATKFQATSLVALIVACMAFLF